jgi:pimeloyl-ACP methyl ester carboxylesterase
MQPGKEKKFAIDSGWNCCFELRIKGACYIRSWGRYIGGAQKSAMDKAQSTYLLRFWQEVDPNAVNSRAPKVRLKADLFVDQSLAPIRYALEVAGQFTEIIFTGTGAMVATPDGQRRLHKASRGDFLLAGNMPPQLELWLRRLITTKSIPYDGTFFSPEGMQALPYGLRWTNGELVSSLGERLLVDPDGSLREIRLPQSEMTLTRVSLRPPNWRTTNPKVRRRPLCYLPPPKRSSTRLVDFRFRGPGGTVGASLAMPRGHQAIAAALFMGGSGSYDRHGIAATIDLGYHDMLDRLAAAGVASLRFDKRGIDTRRGKDGAGEPSFEAVIAEAEAALEAMSYRPEIAGLPVILCGHSEGGLVALDIAVRRPDVAGLVLLGVAGRPIDEVLAAQVDAQARELGLSESTREQLLRDNREFFDIVRAASGWDQTTVSAAMLARRKWRRFYAEQLTRDPLALASELRVPVLILQGDRDEQVSMDDAERLRTAALNGGANVSLRVMTGLDHLFKRPKGSGRFDAYFDRRRRPAKLVVDLIAGWVERVAAGVFRI